MLGALDSTVRFLTLLAGDRSLLCALVGIPTLKSPALRAPNIMFTTTSDAIKTTTVVEFNERREQKKENRGELKNSEKRTGTN